MTVLADEIKKMIIDVLVLEDMQPADIDDDEPLFGDGLGLDSIDALELGHALKKNYNIELDAESETIKEHFFSVNTIVKFIESTR